MGPSAKAGMNVSAPTIKTTVIKTLTNRGVWVGSVPVLAGVIFFLLSDPAIASTGTINQYRLIHIKIPPSMLWVGTLALNPANAEPLLFAMLE